MMSKSILAMLLLCVPASAQLLVAVPVMEVELVNLAPDERTCIKAISEGDREWPMQGGQLKKYYKFYT